MYTCLVRRPGASPPAGRCAQSSGGPVVPEAMPARRFAALAAATLLLCLGATHAAPQRPVLGARSLQQAPACHGFNVTDIRCCRTAKCKCSRMAGQADFCADNGPLPTPAPPRTARMPRAPEPRAGLVRGAPGRPYPNADRTCTHNPPLNSARTRAHVHNSGVCWHRHTVHNSPGLWGHVSRACPQWGGWGSAHVRDALAPPHSWRPRAQAQTASTRTPTRTPTAAAARGRAAPRPRTVRMPRCPVRPTRKRAFCIKLHAGSEMACALVFYCVKVASSAPAHHCCKPAGMCNLKFGMGGTSPWLRMC